MRAKVPEGECAIVKARAMSESRAAAIEAHARAENGVEKTGADRVVPFGFQHPEVVLLRVRIEPYETHAPHAHAGDAGQVDLASALQRELDQGLRAQLLWHRCVQPDAFARCEPGSVGDGLRHRARRADALAARDGAALCEELLAQNLLRRHSVKEKSATRKCRCESLLSNQSNKVGPAPTFKAFRPRADLHSTAGKAWSLGVYITVER